MEYACTVTFSVPVPSPDEASLVDSNHSPNWAYDIQYTLNEATHQIIRTATNATTLASKQAVLANKVTALEFSRQSAIPELITITASVQQELANGRKIPEDPLRITVQAEARNP